MKKKHTGKRLAALTAALTILLCASGCGSGEQKQEPAGTASATTTQAQETQAPVKVTLPPKTTAPGAEEKKTDPKIGSDIPCTPAMWKATSPSGHEMYMMGSMHALNDTCSPMPDYVMNAYNECDILAVECDISDILSSSGAQLKYSDKMTYPDGETVEDHLSETTWDNLRSYFEYYKVKPEKYEKTSTWAIYSAMQTYTVEKMGLSAERGLDRFLLESAHKDGKEIYEVESVDSQLTMLMSFPEELYDMMLSGYSADSADALLEQNIELFKAWKSGDVEWVAANAESDVGLENATPEQKAMVEDFYKTMYYDRNAHMTKDAEELINGDKKVFYVVGLAHFTGETGMISQLEKDGYTIERVDKAG